MADTPTPTPNPIDRLALGEGIAQNRLGFDPKPMPSFSLPELNMPSLEAQGGDPLAALNASVVQNAHKGPLKGGSINQSLGDVKSDRYNFVLPGADNEDIYGSGQSWLDKMANGVVKGASLAATTALQGTVGMVNGVFQAVKDGRFASFYDNSFNQSLDQWNKKLEDSMPNYYSATERNADWYSPSNLLTANFLWDKIVKNMGFAAGAYLSGAMYSKVLQGIGLTARAISAGKAGEAIAATEDAILDTVPKADRLSKALTNISDLAKQTLSKYNLYDKGQRALVAGLSTFGEAGSEALNNLNDFRNDRIKEYQQAHGHLPTGADLDRINKMADGVGNASFLLNTALLTATNYIQLPKVIGSSYRGEKAAINAVEGEVGDVAKNAAGEYTAKVPTTFFGKALNRASNYGKYFFSPSEAFEEGAQSTIQFGTQNYYNKKYQRQDADVLSDMFGEGLKKTLSTKDGIESILLGGISGRLMENAGEIRQGELSFGDILTGRDAKGLRHNTAQLVAGLNKYKFLDYLKDSVDTVNRGKILQAQRQDAIRQGDILESKDLEADYTHNYLAHRIKYGRMDLVQQDLDDARKLSLTSEGWNQMVTEGMVTDTDTPEAFRSRLDNIQEHAKNVKQMFEALNIRYSGKVDQEGKRLYSDAVIDKMIYAASKISDYDTRLRQVAGELVKAGVPVDEATLQAMTLQEKDSDERGQLATSSIVETLQHISDMNVIEDTKETLKQHFKDYLEMNQRRQSFINDYKDLKENPAKYSEQEVGVPEDQKGLTPEARAAAQPKQTIKVQTADGEEELEVGTEYYLGRVVDHDQKGNEVYRFPKLTILGKNADGTIKVRGSNGEEKDVSEKELEKYKLGKVSDTQNNKKAKFFMEHANTVFAFNFGKAKGGKQNGRLQYAPKQGVLHFVYKDKKGRVKTMEVTGDMFVAKKGYREALLTPVGHLTSVQQEALNHFGAEKDSRVDARRAARLAILDELIDESTDKIRSLDEKIARHKEQLTQVSQELEDMTSAIEKGAFDQYKGGTFKGAVKQNIQTAMKLSRTKETLEKALQDLESEKAELEHNVEYFYQMSEAIDEMPSDSQDFLQELKEQVSFMEDLALETGKTINKTKGIIEQLQSALDTAVENIYSLIGKFEGKYPKAPTSLEPSILNPFLAANPNFLKNRPGFIQDLRDLEAQIAAVEDKTIAPNEKGMRRLTDKIARLNAQLSELDGDMRARQAVLDKFQQKMDAYKAEQDRIKRLTENQAIQDEIFGTQWEMEDTAGGTPTGSREEDEKQMKEDPKKAASEIFTSTISPSEGLKAHHQREQVFFQNVDNLPTEERKTIRAMLVTEHTEEALGLKGLIQKLKGDANIKTTDPEEGIIATVYIKDEDGKRSFVDKNGQPIGELGAPVNLDQAVYSVLPTPRLEDGKGRPRYRSGEKQEAESFVEGYRAFRKEVLGYTGAQTRLFDFNVSRGIPIHHEVEGARVEHPAVGSLIHHEDLSTPGLIQVSTTGVVNTSDGRAVTVPLGRPMLRKGSTLQFLNNHNLTQNQRSTVFHLVQKLAQGLQETGKLDRGIIRYLQGVLFWRVPGEKATPGRNQIWVGMDGKLHLGKNGVSIAFTPQSLQEHRQLLEAYLSGTYSNANNAYLSGELASQPFEEYYTDEDGKLQTRTWKTYQHYLLSPSYDLIQEEEGHREAGKPRATAELPLTTTVRPLVSEVENDHNYEQKYATLQALDIPAQPVVKKAAAAPQASAQPQASTPASPFVKDGKTEHEYTTKEGEKIFYTISPQGEITTLAKGDRDKAIARLSAFAAVQEASQKSQGTNVPVSVAEAAQDFLETGIQSKMKAVEEAAKNAPPPPPSSNSNSNSSSNSSNSSNNAIPGKTGTAADAFGGPPITAPKTEVATGPAREFTTSKGEKLDYTTDAAGDVHLQAGKDLEKALARVAAMESIFNAPEVASGALSAREAAQQLLEGGIKNALKQPAQTSAPTVADLQAQMIEALKWAQSQTANTPPSEYRKAGSGVYTPENWGKVEAWFKKNLPQVPLHRVQQLIQMTNGGLAWGKFQDAAAYVWERAEEGTAYHEAFEAVWALFTDPVERGQIAQEFRSRKGSFQDRETGMTTPFAAASDHQIKEQLAEEFRSHVLSHQEPRTLLGKIGNFFRELWHSIRSLFGNRDRIQNLFQQINQGAYRDFSPVRTSSEAEYRAIGPWNEKTTRELIEDMTAKAFRTLFEGRKEGRSPSQALFDVEKMSKSQLYAATKELVVGGVAAQIAAEGAGYQTASPQEQARIMQRVVELNAFRQQVEANWADLVRQNVDFLRTFNITFDEEGDNVTINSEEANRNDYVRDALKHDAKKNASTAIKLLLGTLVETSHVAQKGTGVVDALQLSQGLSLPESRKNGWGGEKLMNFAKAFVQVMDRMSNTSSLSGMMDKLYSLAKDNPNYVRLFTKLGGNRQTRGIDYSKLDFHDWRLLLSFFNTFSKQKPTALIQRIDEEGEGKDRMVYVYEGDMATAAKETQTEWMNQLKLQGQKGQGLVILNKETKNYEVNLAQIDRYSGNTPQAYEAFLGALGISFPQTVQNQLSRGARERFSKAVASIRSILKTNPQIATVNGRSLGINGPLNTLSELYAAMTRPQLSSTAYNVENELVQIYTQNNVASYLENDFNEVGSLDELLERRPEYGDIFSRHSLLLKKGGLYFDEAGKRTDRQLKVGYIGGIVDNSRRTPQRPTSRLTMPERMMLELNQNLAGWYYTLIPADSSTEWMMNLGNHIGFSEMTNNSVWARVDSIFKGYLKDEIALAQDGRRGSALRFFDGIVKDEGVKKALVAGEDLEKHWPKVQKALREFIEASVKETYEKLASYGEVSPEGFKNLDTNFAAAHGMNTRKMSEEDMLQVLRFATINYMINNTELHKTIFGDPAQFKDPTKRWKSFLSPRETSVVSEELDGWANKELNKVGDTHLDGSNLGFHTFKPFMKTVTTADLNVVGSLGLSGNGEYDKVNESDGSSWMMDTTYREARLKNGRWSDRDEAQFQYEMAYARQNLSAAEWKELGMKYPKALQAEDKMLLEKGNPGENTWYVLKPIGTGVKYGASAIDLHLDKTSAAPLIFRQIEHFPNARALYLKMAKQKIGYAIMESGRKVGAQQLHNLYQADGSFNKEAFVPGEIVPVGFKSWALQVETSPHEGGRQTRGSQATKLVTMDMMENGVPRDTSHSVDSWNALTQKQKEKDSPLYKEIKENQRLLQRMTEHGYQLLLKKLGVEDTGLGFKVVDVKKTQKTLQDELLRRDANDNVKDAVQIDPLTGEFTLPFEASASYQQIKNVLFSLVDKTMLSPKMNGGPKVQVSASLFEKNQRQAAYRPAGSEKNGWKMVEDYTSLTEAEKKTVRLTSNDLKFYSKEDPYMEVYLPNWMREKLHKLGTDEEIMKLLNSAEGRKILQGVGFRIPTQGPNAIEAFRVKGFLHPEMGDTIVVPSEITMKAGSDFDIDKLNTYLKNVYLDEDKKIRLVPHFDSLEEVRKFLDNKTARELFQDLDRTRKNADAIEELDEDDFLEGVEEADQLIHKLYRQGLENAYYQSMENLVTHPLNFDRLITPNGEGELKKLRNRLRQLKGLPEVGKAPTSDILRRNYMDEVRHNFIIGKGGVGIAAIQQTGHSLFQRTQMFIDPAQLQKLDPTDQKFLGDAQIQLPHNRLVIAGKQYASLSGLLDQAKQYISDKISAYINGYVDVAKDAFIVEIGASPNTASTFMFLERAGVPTRDVVMFMNQPIIQEYLKSLDAAGQSWLFNQKMVDLVKEAFPHNEDLSQVQLNPKSFEATIEKGYKNGVFQYNLTQAENAHQQVVLQEFLKYAMMASHLFELNQGYNYDTASFNDPALETRKRVQTQRARSQNIVSTVDKVLDNSFVGHLAGFVSKSRDAVSSFLKLETPGVRTLLDSIISVYSQKGLFLSDKNFLKISKNVVSSLLNYVTQTQSGVNNHISSLLVDARTAVATDLAQKKASHDPRWQALRDNPVISDIQVLVSDRENGPKNLKLKAKDKDVFTENQYITAFRELRDLDDALYRRIINLAIVQNGISASPISFTHLIPMEDYARVMQGVVNKIPFLQDLDNFTDNGAFYRNNWKDNQIVPKLKLNVRTRDGRWFRPAEVFVPSSLKKLAEEKGSGFIQLSSTYQSREVKMPVVKALVKSKQGNREVFLTKLYKRVEYSDGAPFTTVGKKGDVQYIYKQINAWGDGFNATEYYKDGRPSVIDNATVKVTEVADEDVIRTYMLSPDNTPASDTQAQEQKADPSAAEKIKILQEKGIIKKDCN
jgi:hypothetical protein